MQKIKAFINIKMYQSGKCVQQGPLTVDGYKYNYKGFQFIIHRDVLTPCSNVKLKKWKVSELHTGCGCMINALRIKGAIAELRQKMNDPYNKDVVSKAIATIKNVNPKFFKK